MHWRISLMRFHIFVVLKLRRRGILFVNIFTEVFMTELGSSCMLLWLLTDLVHGHFLNLLRNVGLHFNFSADYEIVTLKTYTLCSIAFP